MGRALARQPQLFLFDEPLSNLDVKLRVEMRAEIKRLHQLSGIASVYVTRDQHLVATFIGSQAMNLIAGSGHYTGDVATFPMEGGALPLRCPSPGARTLLGLRPEHIALVDQSDWRGEVLVVEPTGADTYVVVKTAAGNVTVRTSPQTSARPGDAVGLRVAAEHVSWFEGGAGCGWGKGGRATWTPVIACVIRAAGPDPTPR